MSRCRMTRVEAGAVMTRVYSRRAAGDRRSGGEVVPELGDDRGVVRGQGSLALLAIDRGRGAARGERRACQDEIDARAVVPGKGQHAVVPPRVEAALLAVQAQGVAEAPGAHRVERRARLGVEQDGRLPYGRIVDVARLRRDVEIPAQGDRIVVAEAPVEPGAQAPQPGELVGPLLGADHLAVRHVDRRDAYPRDARGDEARLRVVVAVAETALHLAEPRARQDRDAVVRPLTVHRRFVTEGAQRVEGELGVLDLQLLEA